MGTITFKRSIGRNKLAEKFLKNHRPHAGHFSWETNRGIEECGVLQEFEHALALKRKQFFSEPRHRGQNNDPPDCEAVAFDGARIGIEITELVDASSIKAAKQGRPYEWKNWRNILLPELEKILRRKDSPTNIKGRPYSQYLLVIHSDEPWLERNYIEQNLKSHVFESTSTITRAFLLLSYDPFVQKYPCYEMRIAPNSTP